MSSTKRRKRHPAWGIAVTVRAWIDGTMANYGFLLVSQEVNWGKQAKTCFSAFEASLRLRFKKD